MIKQFLAFLLLISMSNGCKMENQESTSQIQNSVPQEELNSNPDPGLSLIKEMVQAIGGLENYRNLINVEYTYIYQSEGGQKKDVSLERYIFDGEFSWAKYEEHTNAVFPSQPGQVIQGYDGNEAWVSIDGNILNDEKAIGASDFMRKTNFYWLTMMFKLQDPGLIYSVKPDRVVNDISYHVVEVKFNEGVGDVQDIYLLYINPQTKLIDQFLFTVMDFGRAEPLLMEVKYEEVEGLKWPVYRRYAAANWEGEVPESATWTEEISKDLNFNIDIDKNIFTKPKSEDS